MRYEGTSTDAIRNKISATGRKLWTRDRTNTEAITEHKLFNCINYSGKDTDIISSIVRNYCGIKACQCNPSLSSLSHNTPLVHKCGFFYCRRVRHQSVTIKA